jgi:hypothetical protein
MQSNVPKGVGDAYRLALWLALFITIFALLVVLGLLAINAFPVSGVLLHVMDLILAPFWFLVAWIAEGVAPPIVMILFGFTAVGFGIDIGAIIVHAFALWNCGTENVCPADNSSIISLLFNVLWELLPLFVSLFAAVSLFMLVLLETCAPGRPYNAYRPLPTPPTAAQAATKRQT